MTTTHKHITQALRAAIPEFKPFTKNAVNPHFKSKYADLDTIHEAVLPALTAHGVILLQPTNIDFPSGISYVHTQLIHVDSGTREESKYPLPDEQNPQKLGAAVTYVRRYALASLLALVADTDDDGNAAGGGKSTPRAERPTRERSERRSRRKQYGDTDDDNEVI